MTLESPAALLLLGAVPLAALLLTRGLRRRTRRVAAYAVLAGLVDSLPLLPRSHVARRRVQVALFLGALACAALAAAGPILGAAADPPRRVVILLDDLAPSRGVGGAPGPWERLLERAAAIAGSFRGDDLVVVARTGSGVLGGGPLAPGRAARLTHDQQPALFPPDDPGALALAGELAAGGGPGALVRVVTASPARWRPQVAPRGASWRVVGVPAGPGAGENHALLDVELRPDFFTPGRVALFCRAGSFGDPAPPRPLALRVSRDGETLAERAFDLGPGETRAEVFPELDAGGGVLRVELLPEDAFPDDDLFLGPLRERPELPVELVTEEEGALGQALRALPGIDLQVSRPPGSGGARRIRVFDRAAPPVLSGPLLVVAPPQGMPGMAYRGDAIAPGRARAAGASALLRGVATEGLRAARIPIYELPRGVEPLLTAGGHPLVAAGRAPGGARLAIVAFDPLESGWTHDPSFPILVANLVAWLAEGAEGTRSSLLVGDPLPDELAATVRRLVDPAGAAVPEPDGGWGSFRFPVPGEWRLEGPGAGALFVNLLDEGTSAALARPVGEGEGGDPAEDPRPFRAGGRGALLALAIALLVAERLVAPRRTAGRLA